MKKKKRIRTVQRERRHRHGNYMTVHVFPVFQKAGARRKKSKPSSEIQEKYNQKQREERVTQLINENFNNTDFEGGLGFDDAHLPETYKDVQRVMYNFHRAVKRMRMRYLLPELKYIYAIERGEKNGRFHIHEITNGAGERDAIFIGYDENGKPVYESYRKMYEQLWKNYGGGIGRTFGLEFDDYGLVGLAKYIVKDPETEIAEIEGKVHRWAASKNLKRPKPEKDRDGFISRETVKDIREGNVTEREIERLYPGYTITAFESLKNEINAGEYLIIRLRKTQSSRITKQIFGGGKPNRRQ